MNNNTIVCALFVILTVIIAAGSFYFVLSYATSLLNAIVAFVSSNDMSALAKCGMTIPTEFVRLRTDLATLILPFLYIGIPAILIVVGILMFAGGFYYHKSKSEDEQAKKDQMEREMVHRLVKKLDAGKPQDAVEMQGSDTPPMEEVTPVEEPMPKPAPQKKRK